MPLSIYFYLYIIIVGINFVYERRCIIFAIIMNAGSLIFLKNDYEN